MFPKMILLETYASRKPSFSGNWIDHKLCAGGCAKPPCPPMLSTAFWGALGYSLSEAKQKCSSACEANPNCRFANLYFTGNTRGCNLYDKNCDYKSSNSRIYYLFQK